MVEAEETNLRFKLQRNAGGMAAFFRNMWRRWWFKLLTISLGAALLGLFLIWFIFARNLPDATALLAYEPPLPTIVRAADGEPVQSYARERRVQPQYADRSEEHTSELQSLMRFSYAVFCCKKKNIYTHGTRTRHNTTHNLTN